MLMSSAVGSAKGAAVSVGSARAFAEVALTKASMVGDGLPVETGVVVA
jgi:hypothetical protein